MFVVITQCSTKHFKIVERVTDLNFSLFSLSWSACYFQASEIKSLNLKRALVFKQHICGKRNYVERKLRHFDWEPSLGAPVISEPKGNCGRETSFHRELHNPLALTFPICLQALYLTKITVVPTSSSCEENACVWIWLYWIIRMLWITRRLDLETPGKCSNCPFKITPIKRVLFKKHPVLPERLKSLFLFFKSHKSLD